MYTNYPAYSTDGYGERPEMALAKDREYENRPPSGYTRWEDYHADQKSILENNTYGSSSNAKPIADLVEDMLTRKCYSKIFLKSEVIWPEDEDYTISSAVNDASISLGLDEEDFSPSINDKGNQVEVRLIA